MPIRAGQIVTAEDLGAGPHAYTPVLTASGTDPSLGSNGEAVGWWARLGDMVFGGARFRFAGTGISIGDGAYRVSLPVPLDTSLINTSTVFTQGQHFGGGRVRDQQTAANSALFVLQGITATTAGMFLPGGLLTVGSAAPSSSWVVADSRLAMWFQYPAVWS